MNNPATQKPLIFLAFSNDEDDYLKMVRRERENIYRALQNHHDQEFIQVHKQEHTSIDDVFEQFRRYAEQVTIFHYGGHASSTHLQLEGAPGEAQMADAGGLAKLLGQQSGLQLVFLNGCATLKQVALLHAADVKAVIATAVPVNDSMATEFAEEFYRALAAKSTLQKAFLTSAALIETRYGRKREIKQFRAIGSRAEAKDSQSLPWGLYVNEGADAVLNWKLPDVKRSVNIGVAVAGEAVPVNRKLIEMLTNALPKYSRRIPRFLKDVREGEVDERELPAAIIDSFPSPVGEQLRKLFLREMAAIGTDRLKQIVLTYETVSELLCFVALSELWESVPEGSRVTLNAEYSQRLESYFALNAERYPAFNFIDLMEVILVTLRENGREFFVAEFNDLPALLQDAEFRASHQYLEALQAKLENDAVSAEEIKTDCLQGEQYLGRILCAFAFIAGYKLTTIKDIRIIKHRHTGPKYRHGQALLTRTTGKEVLMDTERESESFAESQAVILLKTVEDVQPYLSLSPFVIDKNALIGVENSRLYFYRYYDPLQECYHYNFIGNRQDGLIVSGEHYPHFKTQFEIFRRAVLEAGGS